MHSLTAQNISDKSYQTLFKLKNISYLQNMTTEAVHPPIKHIIENDATGSRFMNLKYLLFENIFSGDNGHLPFARLKLKPVNRMSCIIDYDSSTLERKKNGLGKLQSRAGLSITGGQQGAHGGKCQNKSSNKTLGQCFVCLEAATLQVRASDTTLSCYNFTSWTLGMRTWEINAFFPLTFLIVSVHLVWRGRGL